MSERSQDAPGGRRIPWVWLGVALVMVLALARQLLDTQPSSPLVGQPAPDFSLPLAEPGGDRLRLSDLRGRVVLLDFWATWCGACRQSTPALNALHERYAERGVEVLGVNVDANSLGQAAAGHRAFGARYPSLFDPDRHTQVAYGVELLPTVVLIDDKGIVQHVDAGVVQERRWAGLIVDLL